MKADLIFLHAPSVYDFREFSIMYGPVSDLVPSTPIFEMYPLGFSILAEYLERHGFKVRLANLALKMLKQPRFNVERFIASLASPLLFGIDLHWLTHAHGSLEVAAICKKYHPDVPIVFGGFSSSYFYKELISYPQVDLVLWGDSTEEPLRRLLNCLQSGGNLKDVPNLVWKDKDETVYVNPFTYIPNDLSHISLDYSYIMRSVVRYRDLIGYIPFINWWEYPIVAALSCRGCTRNCATCGGSRAAFKSFLKRDKPAFRDPEALAYDVYKITQYMRSPIFVLGDVRQASTAYAEAFLSSLARYKIKNEVALEFFTPPAPDFFEMVSRSLNRWSLEISLESHDEVVRRKFGKGYFSHEALVESLKSAFKHGCRRADVYFMSGIPFQTKESVLETVDYCDQLYRELDGNPHLLTFISPMAPFLDPGSRAFESPSDFGYRLTAKTLEDHRQALLAPSWKYILNYESQFLPRDELVESTYQAALGLNRIKAKYGAIREVKASLTEERVKRACEVMKRIDEIASLEGKIQETKLETLRLEMKEYSMSTICDKRELEWRTSYFNRFKATRILAMLFSEGR
jgi:B12-binding domain/radical SAM domain protein